MSEHIDRLVTAQEAARAKVALQRQAARQVASIRIQRRLQVLAQNRLRRNQHE